MKVGRSPKSDPQRARVYAAERSFGRPKEYDIGITLERARELTRKVCRLYGVPEVKICYEVDPQQHHGALMEWEGNLRRPRLVVNKAHNKLDVLILLHELAHWIDANYFSPDSEHHGPTFVGIAGWLYDKYRVIPAVGYRAILRHYRVRFRQFGRCGPDKLRRVRAKPS